MEWNRKAEAFASVGALSCKMGLQNVFTLLLASLFLPQTDTRLNFNYLRISNCPNNIATTLDAPDTISRWLPVYFKNAQDYSSQTISITSQCSVKNAQFFADLSQALDTVITASSSNTGSDYTIILGPSYHPLCQLILTLLNQKLPLAITNLNTIPYFFSHSCLSTSSSPLQTLPFMDSPVIQYTTQILANRFTVTLANMLRYLGWKKIVLVSNHGDSIFNSFVDYVIDRLYLTTPNYYIN
ncbi:hypothetical protein Ciccas_013926, partial [Cichlidogyrus casuarinus]